MARDLTSILYVKEGHLNGYYPDSILLQKSVNIDKINTINWLRTLDSLEFWEYSPLEKKLITDGAHWILEGIVSSTHRYRLNDKYYRHNMSRQKYLRWY